jgi:hypothetical protein
VALFQANRFFDQQTAGIGVEDNNSFNEAIPLYLQDESASRDFGALALLGFDYAVRNSSNSQFTWLQHDLGDAVDLAVTVPAPASSYIQGWNGATPTQSFYVGSAMSIMKAVDEASPGAMVNVRPGTYAEQLTLTKDLTLVGAGAGTTIVRPDLLAADAGGARSILIIGGGADVEVSGFTFQGPVPEINTGIFVRDGAHAHIHDNALIDIRGAPRWRQPARRRHPGRPRAPGWHGDDRDNVITATKGGIVVDSPSSQATSANRDHERGPTGAIAQNSIQASRGASATIAGNIGHYTPALDEPRHPDLHAGLLSRRARSSSANNLTAKPASGPTT